MFGQIIGTAGSLLGQHMQSKQQNRAIRKTNQANMKMANFQHNKNMEMANYAFDKDLEMWKMQNKYNSPEQQMKRFEQAGLNKHMIYGQGSPGNATGSPSFHPQTYERPTLDYTGEQNPMANVMSAGIGESAKMLELSNNYQDLKQNEIAAWIAEETKLHRVSQSYSKTSEDKWRALSSKWKSRIDEIKKNFWEKGISPTDATWLRIGMRAVEQIPNAPEWLKNIFGEIPSTIIKSIH